MANEFPDNLTDQEADAILQEHGTSAKEVVNGFIEQLLRERLALQEAAEAALQWIEGFRVTKPVKVPKEVVCAQLRAALHPQGEEGK